MADRTSAVTAAADFRSDIEGLRALAVGAVLLYHAKLAGFDGGYIGVDVFFVLSGFLITRLLASEVARSGTISLPRFWARRARRLLPASTLVLVVTVVAARFLVDPLTQGFVSRSALAAAGFGANILFWTRGGYSQLTLPEPLLHFWSLAVEEQFYLFWPVLLLGVTRLRGDFRRWAIRLAVVISVVSFVFCVLVTPSQQSFTFYWLPARAWELLAGALLALSGGALDRFTDGLRAAGAWIGLVAIIVMSVTFRDPVYGFPGWKAGLPVLATVLVVIGGDVRPGGRVVGPGHVLAWAPLQWIGKRSYAIYLWHFPLLVLFEAKWGSMPVAARVCLLAMSVLLAALSFELLEDPVRRSPWLATRAARSLLLGAALAGVSAVAAGALVWTRAGLEGGAAASTPTLVTAPAATTGAPITTATSVSASSVGQSSVAAVTTIAAPSTTVDRVLALTGLAAANAGQLEAAVRNNNVPSNLTPKLSAAYGDKPEIYDNGCLLGNGRTDPPNCSWGPENAATTVVLFGDSHAAQWFPAFEAVANEYGWRLVLMAKKHCPVGEIKQPEPRYTSECSAWRNKVMDALATLKPRVIVMSSIRYVGTTVDQQRAGLDVTLSRVAPLVPEMILIGDTPTPARDVPSCVSAHMGSLRACNNPRRVAVNLKREEADRQVALARGAFFVAPDDWICTATTCPVVIGNVLLFRDETHLSTAGAMFLKPYIEVLMKPYAASGG